MWQRKAFELVQIKVSLNTFLKSSFIKIVAIFHVFFFIRTIIKNTHSSTYYK